MLNLKPEGRSHVAKYFLVFHYSKPCAIGVKLRIFQ